MRAREGILATTGLVLVGLALGACSSSSWIEQQAQAKGTDVKTSGSVSYIGYTASGDAKVMIENETSSLETVAWSGPAQCLPNECTRSGSVDGGTVVVTTNSGEVGVVTVAWTRAS